MTKTGSRDQVAGQKTLPFFSPLNVRAHIAMSLWSIGREPIERSEPGIEDPTTTKANPLSPVSRYQRDVRSGFPFLSPLSFGQAKERGKKDITIISQLRGTGMSHLRGREAFVHAHPLS